MNANDFEPSKLARLLEELRCANSYSRLPIILDLAPFMASDEWLEIVGQEWSGCDNIWKFIPQLRRVPHLSQAQRPIAAMMTEEERAALDSCPEAIPVYRGCFENNITGWSFSLDRKAAERFPFLNRYRQRGQPLLFVGTVRKADVVALKLDREEGEIIAVHRVKGTVQELDAPLGG